MMYFLLTYGRPWDESLDRELIPGSEMHPLTDFVSVANFFARSERARTELQAKLTVRYANCSAFGSGLCSRLSPTPRAVGASPLDPIILHRQFLDPYLPQRAYRSTPKGPTV